MKLYIPEIGDVMTLTADWTFSLYNERRNETLMEFIGDPRVSTYSTWDPNKYGDVPCTIPAGEKLKVDRIYIRKGNSEFSSLSFLWVNKRTQRREESRLMTSYMGPTPMASQYMVKIPARPIRFWAKLDDVNNIEFEGT